MSAVAVVTINDGLGKALQLAYLPLIVLFLLDAYYLGLERRFIDKHMALVVKVNDGEVEATDLYDLNPGSSGWKQIGDALSAVCSLSVWPFYAILAISHSS